MQKTAEETALKISLEIDARAFMWTFDCLDEDHELESFFSGLPGFRSSKVVKDPLPSLTEEETLKLYGTLAELLYRSFSSDLLPASVKERRAMICAKAIDRKHTPSASVLYAILFKYQHSRPCLQGPMAGRYYLTILLFAELGKVNNDQILVAPVCPRPYDSSINTSSLSTMRLSLSLSRHGKKLWFYPTQYIKVSCVHTILRSCHITSSPTCSPKSTALST